MAASSSSKSDSYPPESCANAIWLINDAASVQSAKFASRLSSRVTRRRYIFLALHHTHHSICFGSIRICYSSSSKSDSYPPESCANAIWLINDAASVRTVKYASRLSSRVTRRRYIFLALHHTHHSICFGSIRICYRSSRLVFQVCIVEMQRLLVLASVDAAGWLDILHSLFQRTATIAI